MMHDPTDVLAHSAGCVCPDCDPAADAAWLAWADRTMAAAVEETRFAHYAGCACAECDPVAADAWLEWAERTAGEAVEAMAADEALELEPGRFAA
jgi:hypothetical protein